jgi:hypothetical protein
VDVIKSTLITLATVFVTVVFKTVEAAILDDPDVSEILGLQYELLIVAVGALLNAHATARRRKQGLFVRPLLYVGIVALAMLFSLSLAALVSEETLSGFMAFFGYYPQEPRLWLTTWIPDILGAAATAYAVYKVLTIRRA